MAMLDPNDATTVSQNYFRDGKNYNGAYGRGIVMQYRSLYL